MVASKESPATKARLLEVMVEVAEEERKRRLRQWRRAADQRSDAEVKQRGEGRIGVAFRGDDYKKRTGNDMRLRLGLLSQKYSVRRLSSNIEKENAQIK